MRAAHRLISVLAAFVTAGAIILVAVPAHAGTQVKARNCTQFRGANRCAYVVVYDGGRVPWFVTEVKVPNGGSPNVKVALQQRRTKDGWKTVARQGGDGPETYPNDSEMVSRIECRYLRAGVYRARGKVAWTYQGVHYARWITGKAVRKRAIC